MPQFPKIIDVSQGYFPCDPNSFPENLHYTGQEDSPVKTSPVLLYDGWNILPTAYGYRSYFGLTSKIDVTALTTRCDGLLVFKPPPIPIRSSQCARMVYGVFLVEFGRRIMFFQLLLLEVIWSGPGVLLRTFFICTARQIPSSIK